MMIRTRGRRLVSRLEALERIYDTRGPRVFRVIFEYGGEPTIVTIYRDENRTEIIEPPPPDDDPDEFFGAAESTEQHHLEPPLPPDDETISDSYSQAHPSRSSAAMSCDTPKLTSLEDPAPPQNRAANASERSTPWRQSERPYCSPNHGPFSSPRQFLKIGSCPRIAKTSGSPSLFATPRPAHASLSIRRRVNASQPPGRNGPRPYPPALTSDLPGRRRSRAPLRASCRPRRIGGPGEERR